MMMMRLALVLALAAVVAYAMEDPTVSLPGVHDLKPDTFDKVVNGGQFALVEFYAPWCGHCKRMTGEYKKLGEAVAADPKLKGRVVVAKVNADDHRELGERFGVQGFPTIKWFKRGVKPSKDTAEDYNGARSSDKFLEFISEELGKDRGFARVEELDALARDFLAAKKGQAQAVVDKVKAKVADLTGDAKQNGELYVKFMEKAVEKGNEWLAKEAGRLDRMMASGSVAAAKLTEMARKSSVLGAFSKDDPAASK